MRYIAYIQSLPAILKRQKNNDKTEKRRENKIQR